MRKLVLATQNSGKIKEFERLLGEFVSDVQVLGLRDFPDMPDIPETGRTFIENSLLKARGISQFTNLPALADGVPPSDRSAHFRCEVALVFPDGHEHQGREITESGKLSGIITLSPRGTSGFGYDPIFQPLGSELTLGELTHGEKDRISHRGIAMRAIAPRILELL
jgi:XTP/dITP diphosphohydrolase